jgi:hypothetical protein
MADQDDGTGRALREKRCNVRGVSRHPVEEVGRSEDGEALTLKLGPGPQSSHSDVNKRFATAASQLGSDKPPAIRLAGVYAMAVCIGRSCGGVDFGGFAVNIGRDNG